MSYFWITKVVCGCTSNREKVSFASQINKYSPVPVTAKFVPENLKRKIKALLWLLLRISLKLSYGLSFTFASRLTDYDQTRQE